MLEEKEVIRLMRRNLNVNDAEQRWKMPELKGPRERHEAETISKIMIKATSTIAAMMQYDMKEANSLWEDQNSWQRID